MDKRKIYQPAYHLKDNFIVYNLNVLALFSIKWFKTCIGYKAKPLIFGPIELQKEPSH